MNYCQLYSASHRASLMLVLMTFPHTGAPLMLCTCWSDLVSWPVVLKFLGRLSRRCLWKFFLAVCSRQVCWKLRSLWREEVSLAGRAGPDPTPPGEVSRGREERRSEERRGRGEGNSANIGLVTSWVMGHTVTNSG